jgi:hypothetical protein
MAPDLPTSEDDKDVTVRHSRLHELAEERATGALLLNGRWGGTVFLIQGRIGYVESALTPGVEALLLRPPYTHEQVWTGLIPAMRRGDRQAAVSAALKRLRGGSMSAAETEILRRTALADAALAALGPAVHETNRTRTRFRPGEGPWCDPVRTFSVADMLAEVDRRKRLLTRMTLGVRVDRAVRRAPDLPLERISLTATQWNITRLADGDSTPLDIAWTLGHSVFATTVAVHQLARLGVLAVDPALADVRESPAVPARHVLSFLRASTS